MKQSMYVMALIMLFIPNTLIAAEAPAKSVPTLERNEAKKPGPAFDQQTLVDRQDPSYRQPKIKETNLPNYKKFLEDQKVQKAQAKANADAKPVVMVKTGKNIIPMHHTHGAPDRLLNTTPGHTHYDPNVIRLGCTDKNSRECQRLAEQLKLQFKGTYVVNIIPQESSLINLAGIRDTEIDWAIINVDSLLYYDNLQLEVLAVLPPKYAHLIITKQSNSCINDLDKLDGNDMIAIGNEHDDSWTTWSILQHTFPNYLRIPTMKYAGRRALSSTRSRYVQGFFRVDDKQNQIVMSANYDKTLKMISIRNDDIYNVHARGYTPYKKVYFGNKMYDNLINYGIYPQISTIEVMVILVSSNRWYNDHKNIYDELYPKLEKAIANSKRGVRIN